MTTEDFPNAQAVIGGYEQFLMLKFPAHHKLFTENLENDRASATAEAVLFTHLHRQGITITPNEEIGKGGIDFYCEHQGEQFLVEVTSLDTEATEKKSGLSNQPDGSSATWFSFITEQLWVKIERKRKHLSRAEIPVVLAITSQHIGSMLMGSMAAERLLSGEPMIQVPINTEEFTAGDVTTFKDSAFFRIEQGEIRVVRRYVSAVLLISIFDQSLQKVGVLHPDPEHPFAIRHLPTTPFVRVTSLPTAESGFETEWTVYEPTLPNDYYHPIKLTDADYKGLR